MRITESQFEAYQTNIIKRWDTYQLLPNDYVVVADDDTRCDMIGVWVGTLNNPTLMFIGIEVDGYTHS